METSQSRAPRNKGNLIGQKPLLKLKDIRGGLRLTSRSVAPSRAIWQSASTLGGDDSIAAASQLGCRWPQWPNNRLQEFATLNAASASRAGMLRFRKRQPRDRSDSRG